MPISGAIETLFLQNGDSLTAEIGSVRQWVYTKLGAPVLDVELDETQIDTNFEEAVIVFSAEFSKHQAKNSLSSILGLKKNTDLNKTSPMPSLKFIKRYITQFGTDAGNGGLVTCNKGYVNLEQGKTRYILNDEVKNLDGSNISLTGTLIPYHIYHFKNTDGYQYFDPLQTSSTLLYKEFGNGDAYAINARLMYSMPLYEHLLRFQWFENFDRLFKSQYTWNVMGNALTISPVPKYQLKMFIEWTDSFDIDKAYGDYMSGIPEESLSAFITNVTNAPFNNLDYSTINDFSKNWIRQYTLALCKETLGLIRGKMTSMPIPDSQISLNFAELQLEAKERQAALLQEMKEFFDSILSSEAIKRESEMLKVSNEYLKMTPLKIYIK